MVIWMYTDKLDLTEFESKVVFLAELAEKSGNPFFHHGVYRGVVEDDMLLFNSSFFLSIDQNECKNIIETLRGKDILLIGHGEEGATSYTNYYYSVTSFTDKDRILENIGNEVLENAITSISKHPEFMEALGCALISRYKGFGYINKEKITVSPKLLGPLIRYGLLFKNRFVYTGALSGINFFVPNAPFFKLLDYLNRKFLAFLLNEVATTEFGIVANYEEVRKRILSDLSFKKLGLDSYDTQVVDYIFDLAESLQISIPIRYRQLYDTYKESIISLEVLERMSPLLRGSIEALDDSIRHYKKGTLSDFRLALINIDNAIELILRNHLLKKDLNIEDVKKINFERLLKKCRDIGIVADNLEKFKQIHGARNQLYHMPILGVTDKFILKDAIGLAKHLFESETSQELKVKL